MKTRNSAPSGNDRLLSGPLDAPFGAQIQIDPDAPIDAGMRSAILAQFIEHGLLVIRSGPLDADRQVEILSALGRIEPDETGEPMRMEVTNQHEKSSAPAGELTFHCDYAYDVRPIPGISLYGERIDEGATPTLFTSASRVLAHLPHALVDELRCLEAVHACFLHRLDDPSRRNREPDRLIARGEPGWGPDHYWARHPAILKNKWGIETLFLCLQHTDRLLAIERGRSEALLARIYETLYAPEAIYEHLWQPHDLLIWDNLTIQHARPSPSPQPRTLRRYHLSDTDLTADYLRVAREQGLV